jgi:RNA polymerase sigma-70 factor (ECF subfamily)
MMPSNNQVARNRGDTLLEGREDFARFYHRHHLDVFRYIFGLHGPPQQDVEDLTAETFLRAWHARSGFSGDDRAALSWTLRIARNLVFDTFRKRGRKAPEVVFDPDRLSTDELGPEAQVSQREETSALLRALQGLPPHHREMVILRYVLGWQVREIAAHMGMLENTVSVNIRRILRRMRRDWPSPLIDADPSGRRGKGRNR